MQFLSLHPERLVHYRIKYCMNISLFYWCKSRTKKQLFSFRSRRNNVENVSAWRSWHRTAYAFYVQWILSKMVLGWRGGDKLLNKVFFFFSFAHKKYSRSFVKLRLNPWCHMDYFTDVLATFLDLDRVRILAVYGRIRELSYSIKNYLFKLNLCSEDERRRSYGFGTTWGWVINDISFIFGWTIPLIQMN